VLSPYRILDLTSGRGDLGPMILGALGAEVIKVEPPGGSPGRADSFAFAAYNRGKKSVALNLQSSLDRRDFLPLAATADFLFEDAGPGVMAANGVGWEQLRAVNPRLVYVAVSPFGQDGPYSRHLATDLTLAAMGGMMALNGDPDRPPLRVSVPQAWRHAAAESATAALIAHHLRDRTGEGRFVDLSVQAAVFWTGLQAMIAAAIQGKDIERAGTDLQLGSITLPLIFPCSDGQVVMIMNGPTLVPILPWLIEDGAVPASWLTDEDWATYDLKVLQGQPVTHPYPEVLASVGAWTRNFTKQQLLERGLAGGVTIAPVSTVPELLDFGHLRVRDYWREIELETGQAVRAPGAFLKPAHHPLVSSPSIRPPGADTDTVLGLERPPRQAAPARPGLPFEGLKVADFSWIGVGPITAKYLADHGAEVVRVETSNPPDRLRVAGPFKDGVFGPNRSQFFGAFNTSKRSIALNLKTPEAQEIARRLIDWADVVLESFTPGTMAGFGLGYEDARRINPSIVYASTCLMGQDGPAAPLAGYGYHAAAICGFYEVTGWPGRPPSGPFTAYTDTIAPRFFAAAVMAAIDHRARTGEGQYIEQSQMESSLHFLAPEILRYQADGTVPHRIGNDDPAMAPHGAYPAAGTDEWVAIAVETDGQWEALRELIGEQWAREPAYRTFEGRRAARAAIDARLSRWTSGQDMHEAMARLQAAGVPAGAAQRSSDHLADPQLAHRRFFHPLEHAEMGTVPYEGHQFIISGYESGPRSPAPCLGEHSMEILLEVLGLDGDEVARLAPGLG